MPSSGEPLDYYVSMVDGDVTYRQQYRRCGKQLCSRCAPGQLGHGPYWYAYRSEGGRRRIRYVGKELPPGALDVGESVVQSGSDDLQVRTLGGFEIRRGNAPLFLSSRRAASLFKCLLGASEHRLARDEAMELLWPEAEPDHAATNLRTTVYLLRRVLDVPGSTTHVPTEGEIIRLTPCPSGAPLTDWLDVESFERLAEAALAGHDIAGCRAALERYTGEYLPDDPYDVWAAPVRERLRRLHVNLHLRLAMLTGAEGRVDEAERSLRAVLAGDQGHEEAAATLMSVLASSGRDHEALRIYHELSTALEDDLGVAPSAEIEALRARIVAKRSNPAPEQRSNADRRTNLPAQLTSFVGREWELTEVTRLVDRSRLVTLTGAGGCGKTRLALEAAEAWLDRYPQGVWLVELAGLANPDLVPEVMAATLQVEHEVDIPTIDTLCSRWSQTRMLLVLDNCEHLIEICAVVTSTLLARCPGLHILATSREVLGVAGEIPYRVPSLATPDPEQEIHASQIAGYEAVVLFTARAQSQRRGFTITAANAAAVVQVCARLDGLPLAIELAASCLSVLPAEGIARRLDDRFRLLTGGARTALPRQQTLRATVDWSYSLLTVPQQALLRRLSAFAGSWTLDAAESVCPDDDVLHPTDIVTHLRGLINKSLVTYDETPTAPRYRMLETIRQYAGEKLRAGAEHTELQRGHASFFADLAQEARLELTGKDQLLWMVRLGADLDNIRAALGWTIRAVEIEQGLRLASSIWRFWQRTGQGGEGRRWLSELLQCANQENVSVLTRAQALYAFASLAYGLQDFEGARESYTRSLELYRHIQDARGLAEALNGLGLVLISQGMYDEAQSHFEASIQYSAGIAEGSEAQAPLNNLANITRYHGNYRAAVELYEQALEMQRRMGHTEAVLNTLNNLAQVYGTLGDYESAGAMVGEGLAGARESGLMNILENVLATKAVLELETGHLADAEATLEECLQLSHSLESRELECLTLVNLAELKLLQGEPERSTALAEQSLASWRQRSDRRGEAFALLALAESARMQREYGRAQLLLDECLTIRRSLGDPVGTVDVLETAARLRKDLCDLPDAIVLFSAAATLRERLGTPMSPVWRTRHEQDITELHERIGPVEYASRWEEGRRLAPTYLPEKASNVKV